MPFRVSFFLEQRGDLLSGYSMNFWNTSSDLSTVKDVATALRNQLQVTTGKGNNVPVIRISDLANFRAVELLRFASPKSSAGTNTSDADFVNTAGLLVLNGTPPYLTRQWIRGLPDDTFNSAGRYLPTPGTQTNIKNLMGLLTNGTNGWVIKVQDKSQAKKTLVAVTLPGVCTVTAHGYATDDKVRISRTGGISGLNGIWKIVVIDSNTFSLVAVPGGAFTGSYSKPGTVQKQVKVYQGITGGGISRATSHKTGRPFGQSSGRQKRRAK